MRAAEFDSVAAAGTATENQASGDIVPVENAAPVVAVPVTDPVAAVVAVAVVAFEETSVAGVVGQAFVFVGPASLAYSVASSSFASSCAVVVVDLAVGVDPVVVPEPELEPVSELEPDPLLHTCWDGRSFPPTLVVVFVSSFEVDSIASPFATSLDCSWPGKRPRKPATIRTKIPAGHPSPLRVEGDYCPFETGYGEPWTTVHHRENLTTTTTSFEMWAHLPR